MANRKNPKADEAKALYLQGMKLIDIASKLDVPPGTVRRWKSTYKWDGERSDKNKASVRVNKGGAPKGNKNAKGGPPGNKKAKKHGLFAKYLPEETLEIVEITNSTTYLDLLWEQITIQWAAIVRAQNIMYVDNKKDKTTGITMDNDNGTAYEIQQAWDKQANFLQAQSRAMTTLKGMISTYDEMLNKNWDLATEEQKERIANIKAKTATITADDIEGMQDDGFIEALGEEADKIWEE